MSRVLSADVRAHVVPPGGADALASVDLPLVADDRAMVVGLWEAGPGTDQDIEVDEVFLVLAGAGVVTFEDGSTIDLRPGVLVRLYAGDRTRWELTERLRKLYLA